MKAEKRRAGRAIRKARREEMRRTMTVARGFQSINWRQVEAGFHNFARAMRDVADKMRVRPATHENGEKNE